MRFGDARVKTVRTPALFTPTMMVPVARESTPVTGTEAVVRAGWAGPAPMAGVHAQDRPGDGTGRGIRADPLAGQGKGRFLEAILRQPAGELAAADHLRAIRRPPNRRNFVS